MDLTCCNNPNWILYVFQDRQCFIFYNKITDIHYFVVDKTNLINNAIFNRKYDFIISVNEFNTLIFNVFGGIYSFNANVEFINDDFINFNNKIIYFKKQFSELLYANL